MSNTNSALPFNRANLKDLEDAFGVPRFSGAASENWDVTLNGMVLQGGSVSVTSSTTVVPFNVSFPKQVLGVFCTCSDAHALGVTVSNLNEFTITHGTGGTHSVYWWAIGV